MTTYRKYLILAAGIVACLVRAPLVMADFAEVRLLEGLWATDISPNGEFVVGMTFSTREPFRWSAEAGVEALGFPEFPGAYAGRHGIARGVSDGGLVVGTYYWDGEVREWNPDPDIWDFVFHQWIYTRGFEWTPETGIEVIYFSDDGLDKWSAEAVSADGQRIVTTEDVWLHRYAPEPGIAPAAGLWFWGKRPSVRIQGNSSMEYLGRSLSDSHRRRFDTATAISSDGSTIVGTFRDARWDYKPWQTGNHFVDKPQAFVARRRCNTWRCEWPIFDLPWWHGLPHIEANDVSPDGAVIVGSVVDNSHRHRAVRWVNQYNFPQVLHPIGSTSGNPFSSTVALGVSEDGKVVVGYGRLGNTSSFRAWIWTELHGLRSLSHALLAYYGVTLDGWRLKEPAGISDDGRSIVVTAVHPDGRNGSFLITMDKPLNEVRLQRGLRQPERLGPPPLYDAWRRGGPPSPWP